MPQREIKIKTQLQAVAVSVTLDKETTICSVYISPAFSLTTEHLQSLLSQLPAPYILVGDFNGHNTFWGCKNNNSRGDIIENFIANNSLCLMNDKSYTYLHTATGHLSSLDLSLCHPSLFLDFDWSVYADQCGRDHFPVIIESVNNSMNDHNTKGKLNKANWELYYSLCEESLKIDKFDNSLDLLDDFTTSLLDIDNKSIPKTSTNSKKSRPWHNDECKYAIKQRKQALSEFCRYPTKENLNNVKNSRAKARRTVKASKHKSCKSYVSKLNHKTPIKKVWDMIRKISGKSKSPSFTRLNTKRGTKATSKEEIANTLGETFLDNSSSQSYSEKFQNIKQQDENIKLNFTSSNTEEYNSLFNVTELKDAIPVSKDTATGPDDIHYQMLKHLPKTALDTLFTYFQRYMDNRSFSRKLAFGHSYTYSQTRERSCRTNKLQTNSANKLPLQNTRENDKQTTCLVLRI